MPKATADFLFGGGEMGERMRALDWSKTTVGPVETWPQSLKTAVSICLGSRYPIVMWWGNPAFTMFYNDAYIPILGITKHPGWLGRSGRECWSEIWPTMGPMWERVFATGEATWSEDFLYVLDRNIPQEEGYFTFSYSPIRDDAGGIGGIFCACNETTGRVIGERRLQTLRDLGRTVMEVKTATNACAVAARTLAANPADIPFALIYLLDPDGQQARLVAATGVEAGSKPAPERIDMQEARQQSGTWPLRRVGETSAAELVTDLPTHLGQMPGGPWPESSQAALILPIVVPGQVRPTGFLVAGLSPRRVIDADYRSFFDLIAGHISTAIANARAYEEERRRAEALAELDRTKTAFFSNVSHEFRTPLTLILGPVEDALADASERWQRDRLELIHRNALRLQKLVNTLLDFSRIEAGRVQASFEPTDLAEFTRELVSVFRSGIEKAGLRLVVSCPPLSEPVYVDRDMYEKIVLNLLSNAFKFTLEGEIEVRLREGEPGADAPGVPTVELSVRDTGTGIAPEQLPHIFERFHRVEGTRARTHEGTGIGLALVQELVKLHGGSVSVQSAAGQGSRFTVTLPRGKAHLPADRIGTARRLAATALAADHYLKEALRWLPDPEVRNQRSEVGGQKSEDGQGAAGDLTSGPRPRVVWADDNADMRNYVGRLLQPSCDVESVADGQAALAAIGRQPPDLVLADVMMPQLDGFGLLRQLRSDPGTRDLPIILLSARAGEESRVEGMEAGADDYLVKPFSARELLARVSAHLRIARIRREASQSLRDSEERFRTLADNMSQFAWMADDKSWIFWYNRRWYDYTGTTLEEMQGWGWMKVHHPDHLDRVVRRIQHSWDTGEVWEDTFPLRGKNGAYRWFLSRAIPIRDAEGRVLRWLGTNTDITEQRAAEEALKEADRRKDEFLATLAHELRNPLAPIRNSLHILRLAGTDNVAAQRVHEMMERQVNHMVRLVDDLMEVSRITRGKIELRKEQVELAAVVRSAIETSKPLIDAARHQLAISLPAEPLMLEADPVRLAQVLANLLNNAAKYTDAGGQIWLTARRAGPSAVISVRDNGVGIPAGMLHKVFDLFTQVDDNYGRAQGGLGIGLTLVRSLVDKHGGSVEVKSDGPGKGSEFVVRLPLATAGRGPHDQRRDGDSLSAVAPRRILVVDDNRDAGESLSLLLRFFGADVFTVHNGPAALEAIPNYQPAVVLLDIGMPGMDGYEVARRIRQQAEGREAILIALTGWRQEEDQRRSREAGFDYHLVKPVDLGALQALLASSAPRYTRSSRAK
jgi:PAS domain S-box-containing protein